MLQALEIGKFQLLPQSHSGSEGGLGMREGEEMRK